jgi:predicted alpha/beta superfamily hydrolase
LKIKAFLSVRIVCCLLVFFLIPHANVLGQHILRIQLAGVPATTGNDSLYVAGSFNGWNPGDKNFLFKKNKNVWEISIPNLPVNIYEFKFTRGSWNKVATGKTGAALANNLVKLNVDTTVVFSIDAWQDQFAAIEKKHTASRNVHVMDTAFFIPQLNRTRRVWIYLPPSYKSGKKNYPVLYMHDGQNIFDEFTSGYGEWGIDETLDSLAAKGKPECIVVGIDNGPRRLNEYNPYDNERFGKGEGIAYTNFLARTLKPFIDKKYRTLKDKSGTMIAGSSMGGLISYYAMLAYPDVFGKAGIFSPAFWTAPSISAYTDSASAKVNGKLFFYIGGLEGPEFVENMYKVMQHLGTHSSALMYSVTDPDGRHNEQAWRKWFAEFYKFIMADWTNYPIPLNN